jgi:perosamine synthetase
MNKVLRNKFVMITAEEHDALAKILDAKTLSGTSPVIAKYEAELSRVFSSRCAVACSSGTAALYAALVALDVKYGDEVAVPPIAPVMTALPIIALGAVPVFIDTAGSDTFVLSLDDLRRAISPNTKAVIMVSMWGYPCWDEAVATFCREKGVPIIEDAAQAHGSMTRGRYVGTHATLGCFSTHERKLVCTGEGGFVLTADEQLADRLREICMFGRQIVGRKGLEQYSGKFGAAFGLNLKLNAMAAALGICQLGKLEARVTTRTTNATRLREGLRDVQWLREFLVDPADRPNYYSIVFAIDPTAWPGRQCGAVLAERGIISDTFEYDYMPLYELPLFAEYARSCPQAERLTRTALALPTHEGLTTDDIDRMISTIKALKPNS